MVFKGFSNSKSAFAIVFFTTVLLHLGTFSGLDNDLQYYGLNAVQVLNGYEPYVDFFDHKPPLYFYMLLPGALLGGRFFSFFIVHLVYAGLVNVLIFYCGMNLTKERSLSRGLWAWLLFCSVTVIQFFRLYNISGSIIYVSMGFALAGFVFLMKIKDYMEENRNVGWTAFIAGVLGSLSFLTRYGMIPDFAVLALLCALFMIQKVSMKRIIHVLLCYGAGFLVPVLLMLFIIGFNFKGIYDYVFALNYVNEPVSFAGKSFLYKYAILFKTSITYLIIYSDYLILTTLLGLILFLCSHFQGGKDRNTGPFSFHGFKSYCMNSTVPWLVVYLAAEFIMIILQKRFDKGYIYFPAFIPLALLAALSLHYLTTIVNNGKSLTGLLNLFIIPVFVLMFSYSVFTSRHQISAVLKWPESRLVSEIRKHIKNKNDLFTLDYLPYMYLETGTMPPKGRHNHYSDWIWDFSGTRPELKDAFWKELEDNPPTVVTRESTIPLPESAERFMSMYRRAGTYQTTGSLVPWPYGYKTKEGGGTGMACLSLIHTNYHGDIVLYILKEQFRVAKAGADHVVN